MALEFNPFTGNFDKVGLKNPVNKLSFNLAPGVTPSEGDLYWNEDEKTLSIGVQGGNTHEIGREIEIRASNQTGSPIPNGSVVYISGAQGQRPTIALADADNTTSDQVIGLTTEAIANNGTGRVCTFGEVHDLNTNAFTDGDVLYLSQTAGQFTNVAPTQPAHRVVIGVVQHKGIADGIVLVNVDRGQHLTYLHDTLISSATNNELLAYETSSSLWKNKSFSTLGLVSGTGVTNQVAFWNGTNSINQGSIYRSGSTFAYGSNTFDTVGGSINNIVGSDNVMAFHSTSLSHSFPYFSPTVYGAIGAAQGATNGGLYMVGMSNNRIGVLVSPRTATTDSGTGANSYAGYHIEAYTLSGGSLASFGASDNIFGVSNAGNSVFFVKGNGLMYSANGASLNGATTIYGSSDTNQLVIRGNSTQTAYVVDVQNSSSSSLFSINGNGEIGQGVSPVSNRAFEMQKNSSDNSSDIMAFDVFASRTSSSGDTSNNIIGIDLVARNSASNNHTGIVMGGRFLAQQFGLGTVTTLRGGDFRTYSFSGTSTESVAGYFANLSSGSGTSTNAYGVYIDTPNYTPSNYYGLYVANVSGSTKWSIYTNTGAVRFGDTVQSTGRKQAVAIKSANYTLTANDEVVVFTATATATLPAATGTGQTYRIVCRSGVLTIDANGSETIKGSLTQTLTAGEDLIISDTASGVWE